MNAFDIAQQLNGRALEVCQALLPNGVKKGREWLVGGVSGESGESLKIVVEGAKAGHWNDFAGGSGSKGKSLLTLWRDVRCPGDMKEAVKQAKEFLGIKDDLSKHFHKDKPFWRVPDKARVRNLVEKSEVQKYLTEERGIGDDILKLYKVVEAKDGKGYVFPYFEGEQLCMLKTVKLERTEKGKKQTFVEPDGLPCLFGKNTVSADKDFVVITEGEIDAMTWRAAGYHAVSIPMGVKNEKWIELDWEWLERFERIYISFDADPEGQIAATSASERLGRERCYKVTLPGKDANAIWMDGITEFGQYLASAELITPPELEKFFDNQEALEREIYHENESPKGISLPWKLPLRIRRRENTIVTGYSGHGKSQWLLETAIHLQAQGEIGFIASMEVDTNTCKSQMVQIACGNETPPKEEFENLKRSGICDFVFYNTCGKVSWKKLLELYRFAVKRYGVTFAILDSFLLCGVSGDDYEAQDEFMRNIQITAKDTNTHIFVVCHARKRDSNDGESKMPQKVEVRGAGGLTDLAFNVISVWRDVGRIEKEERYKSINDVAALLALANSPDAKVGLLKQKNGKGKERGALGLVQLFFHQASGQFHESKNIGARKYFPHVKPVEYT